VVAELLVRRRHLVHEAEPLHHPPRALHRQGEHRRHLVAILHAAEHLHHLVAIPHAAERRATRGSARIGASTSR